MRVQICVAVAALLGAALMPAGQTAAESKPDVTIRTTAEEVLLDVIARDNKGRFVTDLKPEQIQVFEDGKQQRITSFRFISGREAIAAGSGAAERLDPLRQVRLVSLVFEGMGQDARRLARKGALELLKQEQANNVYYSVMRIDNSLKILQPFTRDRKAVRKAVELATGGAKSLKADLNLDRLRQEAEAGAAQGVDPSTLQGGPGAAEQGGAIAAAEMARVVMRMVQLANDLGGQQMGSSSISALTALVKGQQSLPGRKTVLYFSEGMSLNDNVMARFRSLVGLANSANVAFYAIDSRGLMSQSTAQAGANQLATAARLSATTTTRKDGRVTAAEMKQTDTALNSMYADTQSNLGTLAVSTGGFLVANTNSLRKQLQKVVEDVYAYYEIAYRPQNKVYDGSFRTLEVKLNRPKTKVQSRSGYFAMPPELKEALFPYEVPLLKAIAADKPANDVVFRSASYQFQPAEGLRRCAFDVEVPFKNLTVKKDETSGLYKSGVSVVAVFKDGGGRVVRKFSRMVPLQVPEEKLAALRLGSFIYTDHFAVPPGAYTMEAAVGDPEGGKVAAKKTSLAVPKYTGGVALSDLALIRRIDAPRENETDKYNPFLFGQGKVVPSLRPVDSKVKGAQVSIYFVIYPDPKIKAKPKLTIGFYAGEMRLGELKPELDPPDARGRIPYVASVAAAALPPGTYDARIQVEQGDTTAKNKMAFTVE